MAIWPGRFRAFRYAFAGPPVRQRIAGEDSSALRPGDATDVTANNVARTSFAGILSGGPPHRRITLRVAIYASNRPACRRLSSSRS
jgi:hypothetical protein